MCQIRSLVVSDAPTLAMLEACERIYGYTAEEWQARLSSGHFGYIAHIGNVPAGFIAARFLEYDTRTVVHVVKLVVPSAYRRHGVALGLWLRFRNNYDSYTMLANVRESNTAARMLYEYVGFRLAGPGYPNNRYPDGENKLLMTRPSRG
jgi:ribosomal protein S18 acetylase RimI-like enzyme